MEVEYRQTAEDFQAFEAFHRKHGPKMRGKGIGCSWMVYILMAVLVALFVAEPKEGTWSGLRHNVFVFGFGAMAGALGMLALLAWFKLVAVKNSKMLSTDERTAWLFAPRRLTLTPEGIRITQEYYEASIGWPLICFVGASADHLFLYETPTSAFVVPQRAFPDRQKFDDFVALARQYQQGRAPAEWPRPTGITTGTPASPTDTFRPDTPEATP